MGILDHEGHGGFIVGKREYLGPRRKGHVSAMSYVASLHNSGRYGRY